MIHECFIPDGTLYLRYIPQRNTVTLSRCCLITPFIEMPFEEFAKIDDVIEFAKNYNYEKPVFWYGSDDRCPTCTFPKDKIAQVGIGFSYACNLRCYHCFYEGYHKDDKFLKDLYFSTLEKIKGHHLRNIQLTDVGEPFFYYYKIINYLKSLDKDKDTAEVNFLTNATLLSKDRIDELVAVSKQTGIKYLFVASVDGVTKETYENTRIGGNFEKVIENITYLNNFFDLTINFTIRKPNMSDVTNIKPFFKSLGLRKVDIYYDIYDDECKKLYYEYEKELSSMYLK